MRRLITDSRGLTLVELLVAMSIFSLVATGIAGALSAGIKIKKRAEAHQARMETSLLVMEQVQRDLRNLVADSSRTLQGEEERLTFTARYDDWQDGSRSAVGVCCVTYESVASRGQIVRSTQRMGDQAWTPVVLAAGGARLRFSYAAKTSEGSASRWGSSWSDEKLPSAVCMELVFPPDAGPAPGAVWRRVVVILLS